MTLVLAVVLAITGCASLWRAFTLPADHERTVGFVLAYGQLLLASQQLILHLLLELS